MSLLVSKSKRLDLLVTSLPTMKCPLEGKNKPQDSQIRTCWGSVGTFFHLVPAGSLVLLLQKFQVHCRHPTKL